jgi:glutamate synthase domain-containing protein 3
MTNGTVFVYDPEGAFPRRINGESVLLETVGSDSVPARTLRALIERHVAATGSTLGTSLLENWNEALSAFWLVIPRAALALRAAEAEAAAEAAPVSQGVAD